MYNYKYECENKSCATKTEAQSNVDAKIICPSCKRILKLVKGKKK